MIRVMIRSISTALAPLLWIRPAAGATLPGRVLWVMGGDTLVVLGPGNAHHKIRLAGIHAPELAQRYWQASQDHLSHRVAGRFVLVEWNKRDRYQRIVGQVLRGDLDVCLEQVRAGPAWRYQREQAPADRFHYSTAGRDALSHFPGRWCAPAPHQQTRPGMYWSYGGVNHGAETTPA